MTASKTDFYRNNHASITLVGEQALDDESTRSLNPPSSAAMLGGYDCEQGIHQGPLQSLTTATPYFEDVDFDIVSKNMPIISIQPSMPMDGHHEKFGWDNFPLLQRYNDDRSRNNNNNNLY